MCRGFPAAVQTTPRWCLSPGRRALSCRGTGDTPRARRAHGDGAPTGLPKRPPWPVRCPLPHTQVSEHIGWTPVCARCPRDPLEVVPLRPLTFCSRPTAQSSRNLSSFPASVSLCSVRSLLSWPQGFREVTLPPSPRPPPPCASQGCVLVCGQLAGWRGEVFVARAGGDRPF